MPSKKSLTLEQIYNLAKDCLINNHADELNASALANTMMCAERDGSHSHGLFRLPAYVASLKSGKVNGTARPKINLLTNSVIKLDANNGYAPLAHKTGLPKLIKITKSNGVGILAIHRVHHMAALWPEVEALAEENLVGFACTAYMPSVAPAGGFKPLFGTNPISFAWPRPGMTPVVFDMATAAMAMGEVQIAARDGKNVPPGTGLDSNGNDTTNPSDITNGGVLLPFGGYKGSAIAMMVELLAAGLIGENFSFEAKENDNGDGGPPQGGQFIMALSPAIIAGNDWSKHCDIFFNQMTNMKGVRMPGQRRHTNRESKKPRDIDSTLLEKIGALTSQK